MNADRLPYLPLVVLVILAEIMLPSMAAPQAQTDTVVPADQAQQQLQDFWCDISTSVKIKYAPDINHHPVMVERLFEQRQELVDRWFYHDDEKNAAKNHQCPSNIYGIYEMEYELVAQTQQVVAVFGRGFHDIGGLHAIPEIESYIWLPQQQRWLEAKMLIPTAADWQKVSDYVRENLYEQILGERTDDPDKLQRAGEEQLDRGTEPRAENFQYFEPVVADDGPIAALRFAFPSYQIAPWHNTVWYVEVPAHVLYPHVAPTYQALFVAP